MEKKLVFLKFAELFRRRFFRGKKAGFTLVEILVILGITALISGFAVSYGRVGQRQIALYVETAKMAGLMFRAKSLAIATYGAASRPRSCGYGFAVDYDSKSYVLFNYQPQPESPNCTDIISIDPAFRFIVSSFKINTGLEMDNAASDSLHSILFVPPSPRTLISTGPDGALSSGPATLHLRTVDSLLKGKISVNSSGQIDF